MRGCIVYNYSLKSNSYAENIRLFAAHTHMPAISNKDMFKNISSVTPFDFCVFLDKDIALARLLENMGIRVYNTSATIQTCDNKAYTHIALQNIVPTPKTHLSPLTYFEHEYEQPLAFPFVLKECYGSWGAQVYLIQSDEMFRKTLKKIGNTPFVIQEYIEARGTDYRLYTIGGKVVGAMQRKNEHDFRANCELGGIATKYTPSDEMIKIAEKASRYLNLDFGGIDLMQDQNGQIYFIEANSSAQVVHFQKTTGINIPELVFDYIKKDLDF